MMPVGGRIRVPWYRWPRTALAAAWLMGPAALRVQRTLRRSPTTGREEERRLGRRIIKHLGIALDIRGPRPPPTPHVVVSLHEGFADALALLQLPVDLWFAARDELFDEWPVLGRHLEAHGAARIPTKPSPLAFRRLLRAARPAVAAGLSPALFAQGSILGIEVALKKGAFALASHLGIPILPVAVTGTHRVWEWPYSPRLRYGCRVTMAVLPPVAPPPPGAVGEVAQQVGGALRDAAAAPGMEPARRFDPDRDGYWDGYDYEIDAAYPELAARIARHRRPV